MAQNLFGSICLTDIPKEAITTVANGKKYLNIEIHERREIGKYGDTHNIKIYIKPEQRVEGKNYYIGNLKPSRYGNEQPQAANQQATEIPAPRYNEQPMEDDGLPF